MTQRENDLSVLTAAEYDIAGNKIRAYYDARRKLVFVIDETISDIKPNVLLVINSVGDRKWDDVLANDYGIDLETVRPKKDNKYQKLDIEYDGLDVYADLIGAFDAGASMTDVLRRLDVFRDTSSRRAATERFSAAEITAANARDTISKTNETIGELQTRLRQLRSKLGAQKKEIGREPTKQSASKILRTEAHIDTTNEKLARAKKRLASAQKRLVAAEEDAEIAREILARAPLQSSAAAQPMAALPAAPAFREITFAGPSSDDLPAVVPNDIDVGIPADANNNSTTQTEETKAEIMADEEVKPLFDKDPEILDEEIAFKPIDFGNIPAPAPRQPLQETAMDISSDTIAPAPLSFVPPVQEYDAVNESAPRDASPVLDAITSVNVPSESETIITERIIPQPVVEPQPEPVSNPAPAPMKDIVPAPAHSEMRPVSPIAGRAGDSNGGAQKKPALLYYIMLIALILMSIFTLWIYQKSTGDTVPELSAPTAVADLTQTAPTAPRDVDANPFIITETVSEASAPVPTDDAEPVAEPVVEQVVPIAPVQDTAPVADVPVDIPQPQPMMPAPVDIPEPAEVVPQPIPVVEAQPEPVIQPVPVSTPQPVSQPEKTIPTEEEIIASKPGYNVSQQEKMFVADNGYETDVKYVDDTLVENNVETCSDGKAPDMYGCCSGEEYTDIGDGYACCAGDECFPPLF